MPLCNVSGETYPSAEIFLWASESQSPPDPRAQRSVDTSEIEHLALAEALLGSGPDQDSRLPQGREGWTRSDLALAPDPVADAAGGLASAVGEARAQPGSVALVAVSNRW